MDRSKDNKDEQAPEVVASHQRDGADGMQALGRPENEGLQPVEVRPYYSPTPAYTPQYDYKAVDNSDYPGQRTFNEKTSHTSNRRKWVLGGSIAVVLLIIAIAVGVGVGVSQSKNSGNSAQATQSASPQTTTAAPSGKSSSTVSSTSSAVTSGATGLAQFSCEGQQQVTSAEDVNYTQQCFTQYQNGGDDFYDRSETVQNTGGTCTVYTFRDCIDTRDDYNVNRVSGDLPCKAVTYYANLTVPVSMYGGNCFLKTGRGVPFNGDPFDYVSSTLHNSSQDLCR